MTDTPKIDLLVEVIKRWMARGHAPDVTSNCSVCQLLTEVHAALNASPAPQVETNDKPEPTIDPGLRAAVRKWRDDPGSFVEIAKQPMEPVEPSQAARELLLSRGLMTEESEDSDTITLRAAIKAMADFALRQPSPSGAREVQGFAPCPTCKQYSHSIGEDQLTEAFNHFKSMYVHPLRGHPMGDNFDEKTREAAQILMAAIRASSLPHPAGDQVREALVGLNAHFELMQKTTTRYLIGQPKGLSKDQYVDALIYLLDGPEQREAQGRARSALASPTVTRGEGDR